ncbi:hypothetical protein KBB08_02455 [Candidatus Gracilibacteria bacterium]|nr:hypothetical protein [Candidatus Gracilibacteria bacterium]
MAFRNTPPHPSALVFNEAAEDHVRSGMASILSRTSLGDPQVVTTKDLDRGIGYSTLAIDNADGEHLCEVRILRDTFAQGRFASISTVAIPTPDPNKFRLAVAKRPRQPSSYSAAELTQLSQASPSLKTPRAMKAELDRQCRISRAVFEHEKKSARAILETIEMERKIQANPKEDLFYRFVHGDHAYEHRMAQPLIIGTDVILYELIGDTRDALDNIEDPSVRINTTLQDMYDNDVENLSRQELLDVMLIVAQFLAWIHRHRYMYNDLQGSNIIVRPPQGRVVDFDSIVHYDEPLKTSDIWVASIGISNESLIREVREKHDLLDTPNKVAFGNFLAQGLTKKSLSRGDAKVETVLWRLA